MTQTNDHLVLLCGKSATGKSASLMNLKNVMYLNCESGKKLPFKSKFKEFTITDPLQVFEAFEAAEKMDDVETIVVDSLTYLMDMFESIHVLNNPNTMKAWGDYAQYIKKLMQHYVAMSTKNVIFIAHTRDQLNETEAVMETFVPIKGSTKSLGIESYFTVVIAAKKVTLKNLEPYKSDLLNITEEDKALGFKYVFQTKITKETVNERLRGPLGLFSTNETFMDNDMQLFLTHLKNYYQ